MLMKYSMMEIISYDSYKIDIESIDPCALPVAFKLSYQISIIPAIGGVITELIAGTALVVYRSSLAQLNHYHKALHEDERFLSSVNLLGKFTEDEMRDNMLQEIIRSEIQMNLDGLQEYEDKKMN